MKMLIISDIHGDIESLDLIIEKITKFKIDKLIILGDLCSYYSSSFDIADKLDSLKPMIEVVKGNCDTDEFINYFGIDMPIIKNISLNNKMITITHGHIYNQYNLPKNCGEIFLSGHTHRKELVKINNRIIANPGSIGRPRDGSKSYLLIDDKGIYLKDLSDNIINFIKFS